MGPSLRKHPKPVRGVRGELTILASLVAFWVSAGVLAQPLIGALGVSKTIRPHIGSITFLALAPIVLICIQCRLRRISRAFRASNGRLCAACGYSLVDLEETGTCPECGARYRYRDLEWEWRWLIRRNSRRKWVWEKYEDRER
jgi:hypothetical protein